MVDFLSLIGIQSVLAADTASQAQQSPNLFSMLPMFIGIGLLFYFMIIRPQNKRASKHRSLLESIGTGDEVITNGGVVGKVVSIKDAFVVLSIANDVNITLQKGSIANILPKGTFESI